MIILVIILSLCWGSFLNVLAYRLIHSEDWIRQRSRCPHCSSILVWYDMIPVLSWIILMGRCRSCRQKISWLYPFIELLTAFLITLLWVTVPSPYFWSYALFFSGLIVTIRTDLEYMLILRACTWGLMPLGLALSSMRWLPITGLESMSGMVFGYTVLWVVAKLFIQRTRREGLGQGDIELLSCVGAFTGVTGAWLALVVGSFAGLLAAVLYGLITKQMNSLRYIKIPFGPFLALGAIAYVLAGRYLERIFLGFN